MGEFVSEVGGLLKAGKLKSRETVVDGLANAPAGLHGPAQGREFRQAGGEGRRSCAGTRSGPRQRASLPAVGLGYFVSRSAAKRGSPWRSTNSSTELLLLLLQLGHDVGDFLRRGDRLLVDLEDDVAGLELLLGRRAVGRHLGDDHALHLVGQAVLLAQLVADLLQGEAELLDGRGHRLVGLGRLLGRARGRGVLLVGLFLLADPELQRHFLAADARPRDRRCCRPGHWRPAAGSGAGRARPGRRSSR